MAKCGADLESYFSNKKLSDVTLVLQEEDGRKRKRQSVNQATNCTTLPGHSMVLLAYSGFCKAKLENWSEKPSEPSQQANSSSSANLSIEIAVPAGQLELGHRLIKCMYQKESVVADLDTVQLLNLLLLADRYEVPTVQAAVLKALHAVPAADWPWQTVLDVLELPASCAEQDGSKIVVAAATERLQQELGDLDVAWADEQLQQQLLALPFSALLQLLQDDKTRVASEHTVVYTILQWYEHQPAGQRRAVQLKQLMQQVRMKHCSPPYIITFMMQNELVLKCFTIKELAIASLLSCRTPAQQTGLLQDCECPLLQQYPAWTAAKRPLSRQPQVLKWQLPIDQLKTAVEQHLKDNQRADLWCDNTYVLQGQKLRVKVQITTADRAPGTQEANINNEQNLLLGVYLGALESEGESDNYSSITFRLTLTSSAGDRTMHPITAGFAGNNGVMWGCGDLLHWSGVTCWDDVVLKLETDDLVHPDQCLHLKVHVRDMY